MTNNRIRFDDGGNAIAKEKKKEKFQKPIEKKEKFPTVNKTKNTKIKFNEDGAKDDSTTPASNASNGEATKKQKTLLLDDNGEVKKPQRIKFNDDGVGEDVRPSTKTNDDTDEDSDDEDVKFGSKSFKHHQFSVDEDTQKKWYQVFTQYPCSDEVLDMKENEQLELFNICKNSFEAEKPIFNKRNPNDARWLQTALHKGTAKDRANAGALLVTSNSLGNLEALSTLIGQCKLSNKSSNDVIAILTDLWQEVLLPPQRKLLSLQNRGADWKQLKKDTTLPKDKQRRIYAYWYFENELKEHYFEFLKNLMQGLQTGQEHNKNSSIVAAAKLLSYAPEKEQMLLTMLINKLGDPVAKVASKALHHLSEVAHRHPNMCGVIVAEAEKLLFRNNISERAQHFALCFLSSVASSGRPEVCTKLVNICFSLFKVLVQKGSVNNRTMQAILRCLQKAIVDAKPENGSTEVLTKEMQDTIYRLVHLADIRVSVQTLALLLQLITVKTEKSDRFYNALYVKLLDLGVINIGGKTAAQLLHIIHRAIHIDTHVERAQAFIKRLLQLALYAPANIAAGCLIVLHKLLRMRREICGGLGATTKDSIPSVVNDDDLDKFGSDGEEQYADVPIDDSPSKPSPPSPAVIKAEEDKSTSTSSWNHANVLTTATASDIKVRDIDSCKYDPYHRVPAFAGANYAIRNELLLLRQHYHPTVQVFAEQIMLQKRIDYYGDPLRDFGLPHFLERFAFKNPKKLDNQQAESASIAHKRYTAHGARGKSVKSLTKDNCTEDEMYIFNFLEHKRKQAELLQQAKKTKSDSVEAADEENNDEDLKEGEVNDDEFESYLDGYFGKKYKHGADGEEDEDEVNYLQELGGEMQKEKTKKKQQTKKEKSRTKEDDDDDDMDFDDDWDAEGDEDNEELEEDAGHSDDETGSIDLEAQGDDDDDDDEGSISLNEDSDSSDAPESPDEDDDDDAPPKIKKSRKDNGSNIDERSFAKKLKNTNGDMSSLFAAADDFSALLEDTGKTKGQGTINAVFNKDKASDKQLKWEEKRRSNSKNYTSQKSKSKKGVKSQFGKKRKH